MGQKFLYTDKLFRNYCFRVPFDHTNDNKISEAILLTFIRVQDNRTNRQNLHDQRRFSGKNLMISRALAALRVGNG